MTNVQSPIGQGRAHRGIRYGGLLSSSFGLRHFLGYRPAIRKPNNLPRMALIRQLPQPYLDAAGHAPEFAELFPNVPACAAQLVWMPPVRLVRVKRVENAVGDGPKLGGGLARMCFDERHGLAIRLLILSAASADARSILARGSICQVFIVPCQQIIHSIRGRDGNVRGIHPPGALAFNA